MYQQQQQIQQQKQQQQIQEVQQQQSQCSQIVADYYSRYNHPNPMCFAQTNLHNSNFIIENRYKIIEKIGQGAYGVVVAAIDQQDTNQNKSIAIKKIEKSFDQRIYTKRTLRELKLLRLLEHENIMKQKTIILPRSRYDFDDIYCVSELMETDLGQIIKSDQPLSPDHCRFFIYQILRGLKYIHSADVIHRDLKPRNLLVNTNCDLKICDFGLARAVPNTQVDNLTDYVTTRWYRPPELLLSWTDYTTAVDVWSVGIIFAELMKRKPFLPGASSSDQLLKTFDVIGTPTQQEIAEIPYEEYRQFISELPKKGPKNYERLFPKASKEAVDLLGKMLTFDFKKRITVEQALQHPYLSDLHLPEDEPTRQKIPPMEFEFENYNNLTRQQYKDLVYEEILLYHYPEFKNEYLRRVQNNESVTQHIVNNDNRNIIDPNDFDEEEEEM